MRNIVWIVQQNAGKHNDTVWSYFGTEDGVFMKYPGNVLVFLSLDIYVSSFDYSTACRMHTILQEDHGMLVQWLLKQR